MADKDRAPSRADAGEVAPAQAISARGLWAISTILGIALTLCLFCILIRARLTGILILNTIGERLSDPVGIIRQVLVGAYYDLILVGAITLPFLVVARVLRRRPRALRATCGIYGLLAGFVLLAEAVNPTVVYYLGTPFTAQWLYYSDFLRGLDARNAILSILTSKVIGVALMGLGAFIALALLLRRFVATVATRYSHRRLAAAIAVVALGYLIIGYWDLDHLHLNRSATANPVITFADSLLTHDAPAIYTMPTPITSEDFAQASERNARSTSTHAPAVPAIKNVVIFVLESVPSKYIEAYGGKYPVTPVLTRYRQQAMMFGNIYAHTANTNVSLVALLTSTYPWLSTRFVTKEYPDFPVHSLSGELLRRGYRTGFFTSSDGRFNGQDEFLAAHDVESQEDYRTIPCDLTVNSSGFEQTVHDLVARKQYFEGVHDQCTADALNRWITADRQRPFFAVLWTFMTHHPYFASGEETDFGVAEESLNRYLNGLRAGDRALGSVLQTLEENGLADSTLVVVLGDHGEAFGRHGQVAHAANIYEENVHIPFFLINPAFKGEASNTIGGIVDIAPTILDILRLPMPGDWQGRSLFAEDRSPRTYFFTPWADLIYGYREGNEKYIYNVTTNRYAIYDVVADPGETRDLIGEQPAKKREIANRLAAWIQYQNQLIARLTTVASEGSGQETPR